VAGKCEVCGKTLTFGNNVSFSKKRTNRVFRPNIQKTTVDINGQATTINACTRCIRTMSKPGRMAAKA
jgi:large subunit ribosomal protein L28